MARAVLDVGSNTIRLLVAEVQQDRVDTILDRAEFVRLGRNVDRTGELAPDRVEAGIAALEMLAGEIRRLDAWPPVAIATSAVRDARNGEAFVRRVRQETDVEIAIISGDREAELTYRGATMGIAVAEGVIVGDLGGGSAELIFADGSGIRWQDSVPLGSGRLTERFLPDDPPGEPAVERLQDGVRHVLGALPPADAARAIFTGGAASHVALLAGSTDALTRLTLTHLDRIVDELAVTSAAEIVRKYDVRPERAAVLPAGAAALAAIARGYKVREVLITPHGIREGALLDVFGG